MDQAEDSSLSEHRDRVVLSDDEADEAAIEVAGLSKCPRILSDITVILTKSSSARGARYETHQSAIRPSQILHQQSAISKIILSSDIPLTRG